MSSWKRGFLEILAEILDSLISSPLKKTHITFKCNLDSRAVTKYLSIMMSVGLVEKSKQDESFYVISQKVQYKRMGIALLAPEGFSSINCNHILL